MASHRFFSGVLLVLSLQMLTICALGGYPGTFYRIMMMMNNLKNNRKTARTAPSPNRLWAILDPPGSLGSLGEADLHSNRIIRSVDNDISVNEDVSYRNNELSRQLEDTLKEETEKEVEASERDALTEAPPTEAPLADDQTEPPPEEEQTEAPVVTEAPITCGGDFELAINPENTTLPDGVMFHDVVKTPGWEDSLYPEDLECFWNYNIASDCIMGMFFFEVQEGEIRESKRCDTDYFQVTYNNGNPSKYCGDIASGKYKLSGNDVWFSKTEVPRTIQLMFRSGSKGEQIYGGRAEGLKIEVSAFCWAFSEEFLSRTTTTPAPTEPTPQEEVSQDDVEEEVVVTTEVPDNNRKVLIEDLPEEGVEELPSNVVSVLGDGAPNAGDPNNLLSEEVAEEQPSNVVSVLGDSAPNAGDPTNLLPDNLLTEDLVPALPNAPFAPAGASVPIAPAGASVPIAPAGASVPIAPAGASVPIAPAGASVPIAPAGASVPIAPAGASVPIAPAGASVPTNRPPLIPIRPLRGAAGVDNINSPLFNIDTAPIISQLLNDQRRT